MMRKWDAHIHYDQHFQSDVFEIFVLFSFAWSRGAMPASVFRKWDMHIQCDQHFQFSVFEILLIFSFDLAFGPVE